MTGGGASILTKPVTVRVDPAPVDYAGAVAAMEAHALALRAGTAPELLWLLQHPHVYTAGTSADPRELLAAGDVPVVATGRGGRFTYHGPGQRVGYVLLDLQQRKPDVRAYVEDLEEWLILALRRLEIRGERRPGRVGIWVETPAGDAKIAAIGVRVRRWVTFHGVALNVAPDLARYAGIVPCGLGGFAVTSLAALDCSATMAEVDLALVESFAEVFGPIRGAEVDFPPSGV